MILQMMLRLKTQSVFLKDKKESEKVKLKLKLKYSRDSKKLAILNVATLGDTSPSCAKD